MTCIRRDHPARLALMDSRDRPTRMESVFGSDQQPEDDSSHLRQYTRQSSGLACCCIDRPMHVLDGTAMGLCAAVSSTLLGAVSFVALPILCAVGGYEVAGIPGCICGSTGGIVSGAVTCLIFTAVGVITGCRQIVLGLVHTPETCIARTEGKEWDDRTQQWIYYSLPEEAALVLNMDLETFVGSAQVQGSTQAGSEGEQTRGSSKHVKETSLYDTLHVGPEASPVQIKKAYFELAKSSHPDKNPDDPTAKQRFQEISHAYQILADPSTRKKYDEEGGEAFAGNHTVDGKQMYVQIFGNEEFEAFVGQMMMTTLMEAGDDHLAFARLQLAQWQREVACAQRLVELLQPFVLQEIDEKVFRQNIEDRASKLSDGVLGGALLQCIGQCYQHGASRALGNANVSGGILERLRGMHTAFADVWHQIQTSASITHLTMQLMQEHGLQDRSGLEGTGDQSHMKEIAVHMFWEVTTMEIESTLQVVCMKVTHDTTVDKAERRRRAEALAIVGEIFCAQGCSSEAGLDHLAHQSA